VCADVQGFVSIPSEVGRGRRRILNERKRRILNFRFNPLGGGAGSVKNRRELGSLAGLVSFQSPRRWGGVANHRTRPELALELSFVSIPSEVGRGRFADVWEEVREKLGFVSIPSEVGRGRGWW